MTATDNEALVHRYVHEVWDDADPEAAARFATPGFRRHTTAGAEPLDIAAQIQRLHALRAAFPDVSVEVEDMVAAGDRVAFRGTLRGTHEGEFLGVPATGRHVTVGLVDIIRIEDGRFAEHWGGPDFLDLVRQLGASVSA